MWYNRHSRGLLRRTIACKYLEISEGKEDERVRINKIR